jgi:hypothetical protein
MWRIDHCCRLHLNQDRDHQPQLRRVGFVEIPLPVLLSALTWEYPLVLLHYFVQLPLLHWQLVSQ